MTELRGMSADRCWLARFSSVPCDGRLIRAHLVPRQLLRRELGASAGRKAAEDPRSFVFACGGAMGVGGHHGALDYARTLRVPRADLPPAVEEFAAEHGLEWWLDRTYGPSSRSHRPYVRVLDGAHVAADEKQKPGNGPAAEET